MFVYKKFCILKIQKFKLWVNILTTGIMEDKDCHMTNNYIRFMKDLIAKGYARKPMVEAASGKTWYLPHFCL